MNFDLSKISYLNKKIVINDTITFGKDYLSNTEIRSLSDIKVNGYLEYVSDETILLNIEAKGEMILPCSVTLDDVILPFDISIGEIINLDDKENEEYLKIIDNTIDIMPIIWQNIVVEIPMKIVSPNLSNAKLEGDGWKLLTEDEKMKELDPRLQKLRDLLDD